MSDHCGGVSGGAGRKSSSSPWPAGTVRFPRLNGRDAGKVARTVDGVPTRAETRQVNGACSATILVRVRRQAIAHRCLRRGSTLARRPGQSVDSAWVRAEQMARLLCDTDLAVEAAMQQVGWYS